MQQTDTTPLNGNIETITQEVITSQENDKDYKKLYESSEKQKRDNQSYYGKEIYKREELLKLDYSQDPSRIHSIQSEETRNFLTKLVFPEFKDSVNPYDEARMANKLVSPFEVDEQVKTEKVKSMFNIAKKYDQTFQSEEAEEKFFQFFDATNPKLDEEKRFELAMEIAKLRLNNNQTTQTQPTTETQASFPPAPVQNVQVNTKEEERLRNIEQAKKFFESFKK